MFRLSNGGSDFNRSVSTISFTSSAGVEASRVHGKFSSQLPWLATVSNIFTCAIVRGAFHQLWNFTRQSGLSIIHSCAKAPAGLLPPCPFTITMRRNPERFMLSNTSVTTAHNVATRNVTEPGNAWKYGANPNGTAGNTGTPNGPAASTATRSANIASVISDNPACCSTLPIGNTPRSSLRSQSSTIRQSISAMRTTTLQTTPTPPRCHECPSL